ncbi:MAG TPA: hypothetical protein VNT52_12330, partial [Acidimicrobiales bacterium]|nr:hypothetical protein [Acidimicrobiales bacterium]
MAELPELRTHALPERLPEPRQLYDRAHTYGVAHDLERMRQGFGPAARTPRTPSRYGRRPEALAHPLEVVGDAVGVSPVVELPGLWQAL